MATYVWPGTLPQRPNVDLNRDGGANVLSTPMTKGVPKMRLLGKRAKRLGMKFHMSDAQIAILENFIENTVKGVARFDFPDPVSGNTVECQFIAQDDGRFFDSQYFGHNQYLVSISMLILP